MHGRDLKMGTSTTREIYKLYTRRNKKDLISLIPIADLNFLSTRKLKTEFYSK